MKVRKRSAAEAAAYKYRKFVTEHMLLPGQHLIQLTDASSLCFDFLAESVDLLCLCCHQALQHPASAADITTSPQIQSHRGREFAPRIRQTLVKLKTLSSLRDPGWSAEQHQEYH